MVHFYERVRLSQAMEAAEYPIVVGILLTISILGGTANSLVIALFVRNKKASPLYCLLRSTLRNFYYLVRNLMAFFFSKWSSANK